MNVDLIIREGVINSLPEANNIRNKDLREKVYDAWTIALQQTNFKLIDDIPASGDPDAPVMKSGTQADHLRIVANIAVAIAQELKREFKEFDIDIDEVLAGGLCHDLGKPFEYEPNNRKLWQSDPRKVGFPSIRHPVYGVHIALTAGLPESIAHIVGAHSHGREGDLVIRSLACDLVHYADYAYWELLEKAGLMQ
jgi:putative nucleotidyltransferase with HDIG domain